MSANHRQCGPPRSVHGSRFLRRVAAIDGRCSARPLAALRVALARNGSADDFASRTRRASHDRAVERFERCASSGRALVTEAASGIALTSGQAAEAGQARLSVRTARIANVFALTRRLAHRAAVAIHAQPVERAGVFRTVAALIRVAQATRAAISVHAAARGASIAVAFELQLAAYAPSDDLAAAGGRRALQVLDAGISHLALRKSRYARLLVPRRTLISRTFAASARRAAIHARSG